jgi:hypothetical protein
MRSPETQRWLWFKLSSATNPLKSCQFSDLCPAWRRRHIEHHRKWIDRRLEDRQSCNIRARSEWHTSGVADSLRGTAGVRNQDAVDDRSAGTVSGSNARLAGAEDVHFRALSYHQGRGGKEEEGGSEAGHNVL